MFVCDDYLYKGMKKFFLVIEMTLKMKCLLSKFNVFSIKGVDVTLFISLK